MGKVLLMCVLNIFFVVSIGSIEKKPEGKIPINEETKSSVTQHAIRIDGQLIKYTAAVGWMIMKNDKKEPIARFGYTAYTKDGINNTSMRPVMFAFNGGPGSSSYWLHMGILGPKRVVINDAGFAPPPPVKMVSNEYSIIDVADLVMVDPVGTGFSCPLGKAKGKDFWGVDQDIKSVGAFIKLYVTENGRWGSPKYILGESYGGVRSAGLVWHMQSRHSMNFNGIIMVSPFLNDVSSSDGSDIDMPHVLYLSTFAATAWYHDVIPNKPATLETYLKEVEKFAYEEYAPALLKGYTISEEEKRKIAKKLARYTGTKADYWIKADLRVSHTQFLQELKREDRQIAGRIDSRFIGSSVNPLGERMDYDPFFPSVGPAFASAFMVYLHDELKFGRGEAYRFSGAVRNWDWKHRLPNGRMGSWPNLRPDLSRAITANPGLHVLVLQGYYDLATPAHVTKHDIAHLDITMEARKRIRMTFFEAGHMMYLHKPSMKIFRNELASFIKDTDRL